MTERVSLEGKRYGSLIVVRRSNEDIPYKRSKWLCQCDCGKQCIRTQTSLVSNKSFSCGCLKRQRRKTHGCAGRSIYKIWLGMKARCLNPNFHAYPNYGGRGISICERWMNFEHFLEDMGDRPSLKHTLDRVDNNGSYCKENCRWATRVEQSRNTRKNHNIKFNGITKCLKDWQRETGITSIGVRLQNGWTIEEALTVPAKHGNNQALRSLPPPERDKNTGRFIPTSSQRTK